MLANPQKNWIFILTFLAIIHKTNFKPHNKSEKLTKRFCHRSRNIHCFFKLPDQTKRTGLCVLAHLIHITTVVRKDLACEPPTALLWAVQPPPFSLAYVAASTFHACEGTPASTQKYALFLRGAPSTSLTTGKSSNAPLIPRAHQTMLHLIFQKSTKVLSEKKTCV